MHQDEGEGEDIWIAAATTATGCIVISSGLAWALGAFAPFFAMPLMMFGVPLGIAALIKSFWIKSRRIQWCIWACAVGSLAAVFSTSFAPT